MHNADRQEPLIAAYETRTKGYRSLCGCRSVIAQRGGGERQACLFVDKNEGAFLGLDQRQYRHVIIS